MNATKYPVPLSAFDYKVLTNSKMIALMFGDQLEAARKTAKKSAKKPAQEKEGDRVLSLTLFQLEELIGWVTGEAKTAQSRRISQELDAIGDHLAGVLSEIKPGT